MKYRLVERNDGKYQYEYSIKDIYSDLIIWYRVEHMIFATEEEARHSLMATLSFAKAADVKRVIEEIDT